MGATQNASRVRLERPRTSLGSPCCFFFLCFLCAPTPLFISSIYLQPKPFVGVSSNPWSHAYRSQEKHEPAGIFPTVLLGNCGRH